MEEVRNGEAQKGNVCQSGPVDCFRVAAFVEVIVLGAVGQRHNASRYVPSMINPMT